MSRRSSMLGDEPPVGVAEEGDVGHARPRPPRPAAPSRRMRRHVGTGDRAVRSAGVAVGDDAVGHLDPRLHPCRHRAGHAEVDVVGVGASPPGSARRPRGSSRGIGGRTGLSSAMGGDPTGRLLGRPGPRVLGPATSPRRADARRGQRSSAATTRLARAPNASQPAGSAPRPSASSQRASSTGRQLGPHGARAPASVPTASPRAAKRRPRRASRQRRRGRAHADRHGAGDGAGTGT